MNCHKSIWIGADCLFGEGVKIYDHNHIFNTTKKINSEGYNNGTVYVGKNCWIGSNVILLKGANIGDNCVISAGCVISGVVPDNTLVKRSSSLEVERIYRKNEENN